MYINFSSLRLTGDYFVSNDRICFKTSFWGFPFILLLHLCSDVVKTWKQVKLKLAAPAPQSKSVLSGNIFQTAHLPKTKTHMNKSNSFFGTIPQLFLTPAPFSSEQNLNGTTQHKTCMERIHQSPKRDF